MCKIRRLNCSTTSVLSGIKLFTVLRIMIRGWCPLSSHRFAIFTYICIKVPILRQHCSPPPRPIGITFWISQPRIQCALSLATVTLTAHSPIFARAVLHDNATLVPAISSPDAPSSSVPRPLCVIESFIDVPSLDNFHRTHQPTIESLRVPVSSPASATASAIHNTVDSGVTTLHPNLETSISPPLFPTSPPAVIALKQHAGPPTPSDPPTLPPLASSGRALDNMLPTGTPLSSLSDDPILHLTGPIMVAAAPSASPGPTSAPNLDAAIEDDGSHEPGFQNDDDALDPFSTWAIHANTMPILDPPPQPP
ncbi:hypothetical protein EDB83DRAFT_2419485, partial [Lactarius deliciosus]